MLLSELQTGAKGVVVRVAGHGAFRKRIIEMGFIKGMEVTAVLNAPLKDPIKWHDNAPPMFDRFFLSLSLIEGAYQFARRVFLSEFSYFPLFEYSTTSTSMVRPFRRMVRVTVSPTT